MKKILVFLIVLSIQFSFAQIEGSKLKKQAQIAYDNGDYETVISKVDEMETIFKQMPISFLSLRIKSLNVLVSRKPYEIDFQRIVITRKLILNYLNNSTAKEMDLETYYQIENINTIFDLYPKDEISFKIYNESKLIDFKNNIIKVEKEKAEKEKAEKEKAEKEEVNKEAKDKITKERIKLLKPYDEVVSLSWYQLGDISDSDFNEIIKNAKIKLKAKEKAVRNILYSFSSLGFQSGEIAKYGILFETHNWRTFGFHIALKTSLSSEGDILSGKVKENKTEIDLGPNIKMSDRIYLNIGVGYGYFNYANRNDFAGILSADKTGYLVSSIGLTLRINNSININGGASFMDLDKDLYRPEAIFGITFNLLKKRKYIQ